MRNLPLLALLLTPMRWVIGPFFAGLTPDTPLVGRLASVGWPLLLLVACARAYRVRACGSRDISGHSCSCSCCCCCCCARFESQ